MGTCNTNLSEDTPMEMEMGDGVFKI